MTRASTPRILVADDNVAYCRVARRLLEAEGYEVHVEYTGEGALKAFEQVHPDLVIIDSALPHCSGLECLQYIKNHPDLGREVHVLVCSAASDIHYALMCLEAGAEAYVVKPLEAGRFCNRVNHLLHRRTDAGKYEPT